MLEKCKNIFNSIITSMMIYEQKLIYYCIGFSLVVSVCVYDIFMIHSLESIVFIFGVAFSICILFFAVIQNSLLKCSLYKFMMFERMKKYLFLGLVTIILSIFWGNGDLLIILFLFGVYYLLVYLTEYVIKNFLIVSSKDCNKLYGFNKKYFIFVPFILCLGFYFLFMLSPYSNNLFVTIFMIILDIGIVVKSTITYCRLNDKYENLKIYIQNYNIDYDQLLVENIITFNVKDNYQIVSIDLSDIFPVNSFERKAYVTNQYCYYDTLKDASDTLIIALPRNRTNKRLDIYFTYKLSDGKIKKRKCTLYITIESYSFATYISDYKLKDFKPAFFAYDKTIKYLKGTKFNKLYIPLNSIRYNQEIDDCRKFNIKLESRKWLLHNDKFGFGKSSYDLNLMLKRGLKPIIISPWEENYDSDILQLIYNKLSSKYKNPLVLFPPKNVLPLVCVSFAGLFLFMFNDQMKKVYSTLLSYIAIHIKKYNMNLFNFLSGLDLDKEFILIIIISLFLWFFIMKFLPGIILLKKDNSKIYQEYYIDQIGRILKENKNVCFIIEDIDRLNPNVYNDVFRILSLINKHLYNHNEIIGIISLDENVLKKSTEFKDTKNKIVCESIENNSNQLESINTYKDDGIAFLKKFTNIDLSKKYQDIHTKDFKNESLNFREIKYIMNKLIYMIIDEENSENDK